MSLSPTDGLENDMILGCSYAIDIELDDHDVDLFSASYLYVTMEQGEYKKTFKGDRVEIQPSGYEVTIYLTQAESLAFDPGAVQLQVNWLSRDNSGGYYRCGTNRTAVIFDKQLLRRMLPFSPSVEASG